MKENKKDDKVVTACTRGQVKPKSHIIAVGGGKGGVGKSFISSSLALFLAQLGHKVCAIDLDLGGANLHTSLGAGLPEKSLGDFINSTTAKINEFATPTTYRNLSIISGANDELSLADVTPEDRSRLMSGIYSLDFDFTILDLSAGTHQTTMDFFLMAQSKVIVMTPEPTSIENAYRFMKTAFYRRIRRFEHQLNMEATLHEIMSNKDKYSVRTPSDLIRSVQMIAPEHGELLRSLMSQLEFHIILNQTRSHAESELGHSVETVCNKYFGVTSRLLGRIEYDNAVWQSQRKRRHLLIEYPHSRLYAQLMGVARRLSERLKADEPAPLKKAN